jgi:hypothetical protein
VHVTPDIYCSHNNFALAAEQLYVGQGYTSLSQYKYPESLSQYISHFVSGARHSQPALYLSDTKGSAAGVREREEGKERDWGRICDNDTYLFAHVSMPTTT